MKLSARRAKFVDEYLLDHNGSRAARSSGYAVSGARVTAHRLLTDANVKAAIALKKQQISQQYEINRNGVVHELLSAVEIAREKLDAGNMIRAWCEVARLLGFYESKSVAKPDLINNQALKARLEAMSDDELMSLIDSGHKYS